MIVGQTGMKQPSLAGMVSAIKIKISREALHQRFSINAEKFLKSCLEFILKKKVTHKSLHTGFLKFFKNIYVSDSSSWDIHSKLANIFSGSGGSASKANCKIQAFYEYKKGVLSFFDLRAGTEPDSKYTRELPDKIKAKDLLITDLGYFCLLTFAKIVKKGAFFISRFSIRTTLWDTRNPTQSIDLRKVLSSVKTNIHTMMVSMGADESIRVELRLVCVRVNEEVANQRRRRLKKEAKKKGRTPSDQHLELACRTIMITNVPEEWIPSEMLWNIYSLRWQIELIFKQFKSVLMIHHSNTGKEYRLKCEIYGKLIMAILICRIHGEINAKLWNSKKQELSFDKLYKRIQERAFHIFELLLNSLNKAITYLSKELDLLIKNCIKYKQSSRKSTLQCIDEGFLEYMNDINMLS